MKVLLFTYIMSLVFTTLIFFVSFFPAMNSQEGHFDESEKNNKKRADEIKTHTTTEHDKTRAKAEESAAEVKDEIKDLKESLNSLTVMLSAKKPKVPSHVTVGDIPPMRFGDSVSASPSISSKQSAKQKAELRKAKLDTRRAEKKTEEAQKQIQKVTREKDAQIQVLLAPPKDPKMSRAKLKRKTKRMAIADDDHITGIRHGRVKRLKEESYKL